MQARLHVRGDVSYVCTSHRDAYRTKRQRNELLQELPDQVFDFCNIPSSDIMSDGANAK